jgi:hypothetical protein
MLGDSFSAFNAQFFLFYVFSVSYIFTIKNVKKKRAAQSFVKLYLIILKKRKKKLKVERDLNVKN